MQTPLLKRIDDAILETLNWQGFVIDSISVSPDTYIAICDYYFATNNGMSWMPEHYKGNKLNVVHDMRAPFTLNVSMGAAPMHFDIELTPPPLATLRNTNLRPYLITCDDIAP